MSTAKIELLRQTQTRTYYFSCYDKYYEFSEKETNTNSTTEMYINKKIYF